ncbi:MAG: hypothetical protein ABIR79_00965 [Candidatus Binatia bacterium]
MRVVRRTALMLTVVGLCGLAGVTDASAQGCGDADASGAVTVTDGVATLRSAAGLSSACTNATCDVDGSGSVTVSDGVNVLRKAAGITITENCPGGGVTGDVQEVSDSLLPFLTFGLTQVPNVSIGSANVQPAGSSEDCEDGGSRSTNQSGQSITVTFNACKVSEPDIGRFQLDGTIQASLSLSGITVSFELNVTDLDTNKLVDFDGSVSGTPLGNGFRIDGGPITLSNSEGGPPVLRLTFNDLTVDNDGHIVSGSVEAEDVGNNFDLKSAELEVEDSSTTATVHVVRDDDTEQDFLLNLRTGELTEVN